MGLPAVDVGHLNRTCQELIRIPSPSPPGDVRAVADYLEGELRAIGLSPERLSAQPEKPNLIASLGRRGGKPRLVIYTHSDTVPVTEEERPLWRFDPFGGGVVEGVLYGRGAVDAKSKAAAMLAAARAVVRSGADLRGEVGVLFTADGEVGDRLGLRWLAERGHPAMRGDMVIAAEPSDLTVIRCYKGRLWLDLVVEGEASHSITPEEGVNAIEKMVDVLRELRNFRLPSPGPIPEDVEAELLGGSTLTVTTIRGGSARNVMAGACTASLDVRLVPGQTVKGALGALEGALEGLRRKDRRLKVRLVDLPESHREVLVYERGEPVVQALIRAHREATGEEPRFGQGFSTGGLGNFHRLGVPGVYYGSGNIWSAHRENESVSLADLRTMAQVYANVMVGVCG